MSKRKLNAIQSKICVLGGGNLGEIDWQFKVALQRESQNHLI